MALNLRNIGRSIWETLTPQNEEAQRQANANLARANQAVQQGQNFRYGVLAQPQNRQQFVQQNQAPRFNLPRAAVTSAYRAPEIAIPSFGAGLVRSGVGVAEGLSGLYDLVTPGQGTNRFTKELVDAGAAVDRFVKNKNLDTGAYKVGQLTGELASIAAPSAALKTASAFPKTASVLQKSKLAQTGLNTAVGTVRGQGYLTAREQDVNPKTIATAAGVSLALAGGAQLASPLVKKGAEALNKRPRLDETGALGKKGKLPDKSDLPELEADEIILYHRTSKENADRIIKSGKFLSRENTSEIFLSNKKAGQNMGYGDTVVPVRVRRSAIRLDDEFPSGEQHFAVKANKANPYIKPTQQLDEAGAVGTQASSKLPEYGVKKASAVDKVFRSTRSVIERQGEAGKQLGGLLRKSRDIEEIYQADISRRLPTVGRLKGNDFEAFVDSVEGKMQPPNEQIARAVSEWRAVAPEIRNRAIKAGVDVGDLGETYFPHKIDYDKVLKNKDSYNSAINHMVDSGQATDIEDAIQKLNYARDVSRNRRFGNLEAPRTADLPLYDKSPNALVEYIQGAAKRIAQAETFGPDDSVALQHLQRIAREGYDTEAAREAFNVAVGAKQYNPTLVKASGNIRKAMSTTKLGLGAITNAGQSINTAIKTGNFRTLRAMAAQLDPEQKAFVDKTGVVAKAVLDDLKQQEGFAGKVLSKITAPGFNAVEKFNRRVAAIAGKDYAESLARKGDVATLQKLGVKGEIGKELTETQKIQAARMVVEKTQFKVDPQDLPGWASSPGGKLVAQFRTFAYNQSKFFSNEILKPAANGNLVPLGRLLTALPLGYAIYETKRTINKRPEEENLARRGLEAFKSAGGAGVAQDIFSGLVPLNGKYVTPERRVSMAVGTLGGPAAGTAAEWLGAVSNAAQKNPTQLGRVGLKTVPIVGSRLQNTLLPYQTDKNNAANQAAREGTATLEQKKTVASKELADLKKKPSEGYSLQQLADGRYAYNLNGEIKTSKRLKDAQRAIARDSFENSDKQELLTKDRYYYKDSSGDVRYMSIDAYNKKLAAAQKKAKTTGANRRVASGGRRSSGSRKVRSAGSPYKYAVSPTAGGQPARPKVSVKKTGGVRGKAKAKVASAPKVSIKKSLV